MEVHQHPEKKHYIVTEETRCKGCGLCIEFCPRNCLGFSKEYNEKGWRVAKMYQMKDCIKCYMCERMCPDFAIYVVEAETKVAETKEVSKATG